MTTGAERQAARDMAKAQQVAKTYAGLPYPTGPNKPLPRRKHLGAGGSTPSGRNRCGAAVAKARRKWMVAPVAAQVHPERHTQPRSKRRVRP